MIGVSVYMCVWCVCKLHKKCLKLLFSCVWMSNSVLVWTVMHESRLFTFNEHTHTHKHSFADVFLLKVFVMYFAVFVWWTHSGILRFVAVHGAERVGFCTIIIMVSALIYTNDSISNNCGCTMFLHTNGWNTKSSADFYRKMASGNQERKVLLAVVF